MKLDNIGSTNSEYKNISKITISIFIFLLEFYIVINMNYVDIFSFKNINSVFFRIILQSIMNLLIFSVSYTVIYHIVKFVYIRIWIYRNKNIWIKGTWLHIHVKDEIRVGTVNFKQNFHTIEAEGHNIYPDGLGYDSWRETKWKYVFGKIKDSNLPYTDLIGFYRAGHAGSQDAKDGIHSLEIDDSKKGRLTTKMTGLFKDTVKKGDVVTDDKVGDLFLFRAEDELLEYLRNNSNGPINYHRLSRIHEQDQFQYHPYVIQLKKSIQKLNNSNLIKMD